MKKSCTFLLCVLISFCVIATGISFTELESTDSHLDQFSRYNQTPHDNIDDNATAHTHQHKHSKSGKRHEHSHDHLKISQFEISIIDRNLYANPKTDEIESNQFYEYNALISNAHPIDLFRPPIS